MDIVEYSEMFLGLNIFLSFRQQLLLKYYPNILGAEPILKLAWSRSQKKTKKERIRQRCPIIFRLEVQLSLNFLLMCEVNYVKVIVVK